MSHDFPISTGTLHSAYADTKPTTFCGKDPTFHELNEVAMHLRRAKMTTINSVKIVAMAVLLQLLLVACVAFPKSHMAKVGNISKIRQNPATQTISYSFSSWVDLGGLKSSTKGRIEKFMEHEFVSTFTKSGFFRKLHTAGKEILVLTRD